MQDDTSRNNKFVDRSMASPNSVKQASLALEDLISNWVVPRLVEDFLSKPESTIDETEPTGAAIRR